MNLKLIPNITRSTHTPPEIETEQFADEARFYTNICEPFNLQIRRFENGEVKLIWWYIAAVDEEKAVEFRTEEEGEKFGVEWYGYENVLEKLTFEMDRDMVKRAIEIVGNI